MANKVNYPEGGPAGRSSPLPDLAPALLEKLLLRSDSIVWRARVEMNDGVGPVEDPGTLPLERWGELFDWHFECVSSSPRIKEWLGCGASRCDANEIWASALLSEHLPEMNRCSGLALVTGASGYEQDFPMRGCDGEVRWMHEVVEITPIGEGLWDLVGLVSDITQRMEAETSLVQSEAKFRSIWEHSMDGMRLTDWEGTILAVNKAFCRLVGLSEEELIGRPLSVAYSMEKSPEEMLEDYRERCSEPNPGSRYSASVVLATGERREFELSFSRIEGEGAESTILTIFRDVTESRHAEERRLQLERKMLDAQRLESLGTLAGGIAHDFNNLLTSILGNTNLTLMHLAPSSPLRPFLESVEKTSMQAADLCKQMLAYSGRSHMEFQCLSINSLVEEMNHLLEVSVHKQIVLRYRLAQGLPSVLAGPSEIQQVIMNLVINASEAIGDRSGVIAISSGLVRADRAYLEETFLAPDLPECDYVSLEVADSGCGMNAETKARIFDPFFSTKFTGRGLGLAAVLGILQRHKGAFKVYSEPNQGTTIKILLPAVDEEVEREARLVAQPVRWQTRGTILVVDDEQAVRAVAARMLERCGLTVLLAKDGREGVEVFRAHREELDLVLLDMTMPVMGGEEAYREIRRLNPDAKVLLMSGYTESETTERFAGKGLAGFLQKPFKWEHLEKRLQELLDGETDAPRKA